MSTPEAPFLIHIGVYGGGAILRSTRVPGASSASKPRLSSAQWCPLRSGRSRGRDASRPAYSCAVSSTGPDGLHRLGLCGVQVVLQAPICDYLAFDPFAFEGDGLGAPEGDVGWS